MDKNKILVFILLIFSLVVTAALVLTIAIKGNNQEFKERTLILIDETKEGTTTSKVEYTICQWTKTKIEIKECRFENDVKKECSLNYPGFGDYQFKDEEFINLLDALEIQPGDTTTINMEDLGDEIWKKYKYLFGEGGDGEGEGEGEGGAAGGQTVGKQTVVVTVSTTKTATVTIGR